MAQIEDFFFDINRVRKKYAICGKKIVPLHQQKLEGGRVVHSNSMVILSEDRVTLRSQIICSIENK